MLVIVHMLHLLVVAAYLSAPVAALVLDVRSARRRRRTAPSPGYVATICTGIAVGSSVSVAYAVALGGRANMSQIALASYFASALLFLLNGFDRGLRGGLKAILGKRTVRHIAGASVLAVVNLAPSSFPATFPAAAASSSPPPSIRRPRVRNWTGMLAGLIRVVLLFGLGLPYILAAGLTYRPKVLSHDDPRSRLGLDYQPVMFDSTDGVRLSGWWIPALNQRRRANRAHANSTVVICPGPGVGRSSALALVPAFAPNGYNILLFDFRGHGQSEGQVTTFGDLERRDVLGAVNWLQRDHAGQSRKIFGMGIETGGAALIGAAADPSPAGQAIDAIAVCGGFDDLPALISAVSKENFLPPANWLVTRIALRMASIQTGADLYSFSPGRDIGAIWPRPVFIIHGVSDQTFPWELDRRLFDSAAEPKHSRWVEDATNQQLLTDEPTLQAVREFFDSAEPMPII